jgi:hypothetical protein
MSVTELELEIVRIEFEHEGGAVVDLDLGPNELTLDHLRQRLAIDDATHLFLRDEDEPLGATLPKRSNMRLIGHRKRTIDVVVRYEHHEKARHFSPAVTVFKVLQWAVSKRAYGLDPIVAAKANLMLPGAEQPLARDKLIGSVVEMHCDRLVLDLTLKDFTNGGG